MTILRLAIPSPLRRLFDYLPPSDVDNAHIEPGIRVLVPFGKRDVIGILVEVTDTSDFSINKLKHAKQLLDSEPPLPQHLFKLARWAASYYQHPEGDALQHAIPVLLRKGQPCEYQHEMLWRAKEGANTDTLKANATLRQIELLSISLTNTHPRHKPRRHQERKEAIPRSLTGA